MNQSRSFQWATIFNLSGETETIKIKSSNFLKVPKKTKEVTPIDNKI